MHAIDPSSLDSTALVRRLRQLSGDERALQVEFLVHLDELDRRGAYRDAGFPSLWEFCTRGLHLGEGAAYLRIASMRALRAVPTLAPALLDGRLNLSTLARLAPVLTADNAEEVVARAAYRTKAEVDAVVVSIRPRAAPGDGMRKVASVVAASTSVPSPPVEAPPCAVEPTSPENASAEAAPLALALAPPPKRADVEAVSRDRWSVRVTIDRELKESIETLRALLSHKVPDGDLAEVLREAVRCAVEKHGRRKGAVPPSRNREPKPPRPGASPRDVPADVRRQVWERDGGRCTFVSPEGQRCGCRWQLELHHRDAAARGGPPTVENLTLRCKPHNGLAAERDFGRAHMARFRRRASRTGESTLSGQSDLTANATASTQVASGP